MLIQQIMGLIYSKIPLLGHPKTRPTPNLLARSFSHLICFFLGSFLASQFEFVASRNSIKGIMLKKELMDVVFKYQLEVLSNQEK